MSEHKPVKLAYKLCEPARSIPTDALPIILLHGFTSSKERWTSIQQELADKTRRPVYSIDARNHGESEQSEEFNFNIITEDLNHFMKENNIHKASFIGHSMGGVVVMELALTKPEKVENLVLEDVSPKEPIPELYIIFEAMIEEQINCFAQSSNTDTEASMYRRLRECIYRTVPMLPDEDQEVIAKMEFAIRKTETGYEPLSNLKYILKAVRNPPICKFPVGKVFNGDALFIYGCLSNSTVMEDEDLILKYFPKAKFHGFETAGHEICSRHPSQFLEKVCEFL